MSWKDQIEHLRKRQALAKGMGGEAKLARQKAAGRLNVRQRIELLLDTDSFTEIGSITGTAETDAGGDLTGFMPANCIFGRGSIDGRRVAIVADDFTVRGEAQHQRIGIARDDISACLAHRLGIERLDGRLGADRHEGRCGDITAQFSTCPYGRRRRRRRFQMAS